MTRAVSDMVQGFRHSLQEVESATHQLYQESNQIRQVATQTEGSARQQESMTVQVAAAVSELAASSHEVREHARKSAELSALTNQDAANTSRLAQHSINDMGEMSAEIERVDRVIQQLDNRCLAVDGVLEVIKGIADQTNLLALNAAIEAARQRTGPRLCGGGRRGTRPLQPQPRRQRGDLPDDRRPAKRGPERGVGDRGCQGQGGREHPQDRGDPGRHAEHHRTASAASTISMPRWRSPPRSRTGSAARWTAP